MKKLLVILALVCTAAIGYGQYEDALPMKATVLSGDTVRIVKDGESALTTVDAIRNAIVFTGGVENSDDTVSLGGTLLDEEVTIDILNDSYPSSAFSIHSGVGISNSYLDFGNGIISGTGFNGATGSFFTLAGNSFSMGSLLGAGVSGLTFNNSAITIVDNINNRGLIGNTYFGAEATDNTYVQKKYVDDAITAGSAYTFTNGLLNTGGVVGLGDTITSNTAIVNAGNDYSFNINGYGSSGSYQLQFYEGVANMIGYSNDDYTGSRSSFQIQGASASVAAYDGTYIKTFSVTGSEAKFTDSELEGIGYNADYRVAGIATHGDFWVPNWGTVMDSIEGVSGSALTSGSGVTINGTSLDLEGTMDDTHSYITLNNDLNSSSELTIQNNLSTKSANLNFANGVMTATGFSAATTSALSLNGASISMTSAVGGGVSSFTVNNSSMTVVDNINDVGIIGNTYFGAGATDNTYVQKKYVDDAITANGSGVTSGMQDTIDEMYQQLMIDTIDLGEVAWLKSDTITTRFSLGITHSNDSAAFFDGAYMGGWHVYQDSTVALIVRHDVSGALADVDFQILYSKNMLDSTSTVIYSGTSTTAGSVVESETFTNKFIPPDVDIWCEIDGAPAVKGDLLYVDFGYAKIQQ